MYKISWFHISLVKCSLFFSLSFFLMFVPVFYAGVTNDVQQEIIAINLDEILFINGTQHLSLNGLMRVKNCLKCVAQTTKPASKFAKRKFPKTLYPWFKRNFFLQRSPNLRQEFWRCKHRRTLHQAKKAGPRRFWSGTERQIKRKDLKIRRSSLWRKVKFSTEHSHQVKIIL